MPGAAAVAVCELFDGLVLDTLGVVDGCDWLIFDHARYSTIATAATAMAALDFVDKLSP